MTAFKYKAIITENLLVEPEESAGPDETSTKKRVVFIQCLLLRFTYINTCGTLLSGF